SATTYINQDRVTTNTGEQFQFTPPPDALFDDYISLLPRTSSIVSEELRLSSVGSGSWQWTVGGFYRHARITQSGDGYFAQFLPGTTVPAVPFSFRGNDLFKSLSVFGDVSYKLTDHLTLGTGARDFQDDQDSLANGVLQTDKFHSFDPRFYAQYRFTEQVN